MSRKPCDVHYLSEQSRKSGNPRFQRCALISKLTDQRDHGVRCPRDQKQADQHQDYVGRPQRGPYGNGLTSSRHVQRQSVVPTLSWRNAKHKKNDEREIGMV